MSIRLLSLFREPSTLDRESLSLVQNRSQEHDDAIIIVSITLLSLKQDRASNHAHARRVSFIFHYKTF